MTRSAPTVSVIVPNYNYEKTLGACLDAIFAQTHRPDEVIVVDDASTDSSREIIARYPCRLVEGAGNKGVSAARNIGAGEASGEVFFFVDSDVALRPDAIANALKVLDEDPECGCVHGTYDTEPLFDDGWVEHYKVLHAHWWRRRSVGRVSTAIFALAAIRREAFLAAGPFDERLRDAEDVEYSERLIEVAKIRLTDDVVGRHDDCAGVRDMIREQFRRSLPLADFAGKHRFEEGAVAVNPLIGVLTAPLAVASLPLAALGPAPALVPAALFGLFLRSDPGLLRFVRQEKGARFVPAFVAAHLVSQLAIVAGAGVGTLRRLRRGRVLATAAPTPAGAR